jgi:hypothetical protein
MLFGTMALAETWTGTVVDVSCSKRDVAAHSRSCAIKCAKGGYGLATADGKFVKFDEAGNAKALAALNASTKDKDLKATVSGKMSGDVIAVDSIKLD